MSTLAYIRLGRSLLDVVAAVHDMQAKGLMVRSVCEGIGPATTSGRLILNMLSTLAEYEGDLIGTIYHPHGGAKRT